MNETTYLLKHFESLGLSKQQINLLDFKNVYDLKANVNNFFIIFNFDKEVRSLTNRLKVGVITKRTYATRVRKHIQYYYNLNYGKYFTRRLNNALKGR